MPLQSLRTLIILLSITFTFTGCSDTDIRQYGGRTPEFDLFSYFSGQTKGWGMVQDRKGVLLRQFVVDIVGTQDEQENLVLEEDFYWSDGEQTRRVWTITRKGNNSFQGNAADVVGVARGVSSGNALNWQYDLEVDVDDSIWVLHFNDWMFLQPDGVLLNKAAMTKFGFRVGEVTIAFQKPTQKGEAKDR